MFIGSLLTYILLGGLIITARPPPEQPDATELEEIVCLYIKAIVDE
ncbi:hypothetical protein FB550_10650 [Neobacillus bataviensis]|uniref:Uncharacterized protein n=1 Tax=Neobacillus bataviensis TaxID=220685 RepID=A0A561DCF3_9BACI|nr:hypothetical protein FB550_10650 [Neobacillus bataviensis]